MKQYILLLSLLLSSILFSQSYFNWDGQEREYFLYVPESIQANAPLVFILHGYYDSGGDAWISKFKSFADENGFAVCSPSGLLDNNGNTHWNANFSSSISTVDDVGFLSNLALYLQDMYSLDPNKTFSCGFSNGGFMSWSLACNAPDVFKAVASVAGSMSVNDWEQCNPSSVIPVMQISGVDDDIIPIDGTTGGWSLGGGTPDIFSIMDFWSNLYGCVNNETTNWQFDNYYDFDFTSYFGCSSNNTSELRLYIFDAMGHVWPGEVFNNADIDSEGIPDLVVEKIWDFFMQIATQPININDNNILQKVILQKNDILGRTISYPGFQFEIYDDGSVEKKYILK